ncbi:sulfotransferase [Paucibacter sp. APW11]|uniref:Sulfotransferase n=1 Tax=Roseateles aquae TaxID=3077235 RepID=A0ABU3PHC2_9BURK|nr:sulfotransferase [Paucibacter sp. APW11]MDT9001960.1 sulfotransferase [Paucibacter sp. APW11]
MNSPLQRAIQAFQAQQYEQAASAFEQALSADPDDIQARAGLGQSLCTLGRLHEGLALLNEAGGDLLDLAEDDGQIGYVLEIVQQLQQFGDFISSHQLCDAAVKLAPEDARGLQLLAVAAAQLNKKTEALDAAQRAVRLQPDNQMLQVLLASVEADGGQGELAAQRLQALLARGLAPREAFRAHKELARVLDKQGRFDQVFPHLHASTKASQSLPEYQRHPVNLLPMMIKSHRLGFDRELLQRWKGAAFAAEAPAPVFLIGFFRSGTTLTQEVLDAHPRLHVADEADFVAAMHRELHRLQPGPASTADKLRRLDLDGIQHLRAFYWQRARDRLGPDLQTDGFVDKFTLNTVDLGLISCVFPDARIVFVMRDPRDVCLSCFMQLMAPSPATVHLLGWTSTAELYAQVMGWWMHVRELMAPSYIEFRYEDTIADFEATFRRVFDFLGLDWDPAVASFHERAAKKSIASPSRAQVAQPLYSSSVARWRHFGSEFKHIEALLTPFVKAFDYEAF